MSFMSSIHSKKCNASTNGKGWLNIWENSSKGLLTKQHGWRILGVNHSWRETEGSKQGHRLSPKIVRITRSAICNKSFFLYTTFLEGTSTNPGMNQPIRLFYFPWIVEVPIFQSNWILLLGRKPIRQARQKPCQSCSRSIFGWAAGRLVNNHQFFTAAIFIRKGLSLGGRGRDEI